MQRPLIACAGKRDRKSTETIRPEKRVGIVISSRPFENSALRASRKVFQKIALGLTQKTAADMGHLQLSGPGGMIEVLDSVGQRRKVLIHINNTNPILNEDSAEHAALAKHGIEVSFDGMEINV